MAGEKAAKIKKLGRDVFSVGRRKRDHSSEGRAGKRIKIGDVGSPSYKPMRPANDGMLAAPEEPDAMDLDPPLIPAPAASDIVTSQAIRGAGGEVEMPLSPHTHSPPSRLPSGFPRLPIGRRKTLALGTVLPGEPSRMAIAEALRKQQGHARRSVVLPVPFEFGSAANSGPTDFSVNAHAALAERGLVDASWRTQGYLESPQQQDSDEAEARPQSVAAVLPVEARQDSLAVGPAAKRQTWCASGSAADVQREALAFASARLSRAVVTTSQFSPGSGIESAAPASDAGPATEQSTKLMVFGGSIRKDLRAGFDQLYARIDQMEQDFRARETAMQQRLEDDFTALLNENELLRGILPKYILELEGQWPRMALGDRRTWHFDSTTAVTSAMDVDAESQARLRAERRARIRANELARASRPSSFFGSGQRTVPLAAAADPQRSLEDSMSGLSLGSSSRTTARGLLAGSELEDSMGGLSLASGSSTPAQGLLAGSEPPFIPLRSPVRLSRQAGVRQRPVSIANPASLGQIADSRAAEHVVSVGSVPKAAESTGVRASQPSDNTEPVSPTSGTAPKTPSTEQAGWGILNRLWGNRDGPSPREPPSAPTSPVSPRTSTVPSAEPVAPTSPISPRTSTTPSAEPVAPSTETPAPEGTPLAGNGILRRRPRMVPAGSQERKRVSFPAVLDNREIDGQATEALAAEIEAAVDSEAAAARHRASVHAAALREIEKQRRDHEKARLARR